MIINNADIINFDINVWYQRRLWYQHLIKTGRISTCTVSLQSFRTTSIPTTLCACCSLAMNVEGDIRLAGGSNATEGRVEIYHK